MWQNYYLDFLTQESYEENMPLEFRGNGEAHAEDIVGLINGKGHHVNLRLLNMELPLHLTAFQKFPSNPVRTWAVYTPVIISEAVQEQVASEEVVE